VRYGFTHSNSQAGLKVRNTETWGAGVETKENKKIFVPLSKKDKNKKFNERWT